ncbi:MAG: hypothetical protein BMS9Abin36_1072 [Gammaproteobacteria bacterium]|nr:MAG: hypothetical protein BMS9Abin36_1072 [Gammaproteobacteria bacterium]
MNTAAIPTPADQTLPTGENTFKVIVFPVALLGIFWTCQQIAEVIDARGDDGFWMAVKWSALLLMGVLSSVLLIAMAVLAHDAVHKVLFRNCFANELLGGLMSAFGLIPFYANRQFHLTHHSYAHQPGKDPENAMHQHNFWFAMTIGSLIGLGLQFKILLSNLFARLFDKRYLGRTVKDLLLLLVVTDLYFFILPATGIEVMYSFVPMMATLPVVFGFRTISDHYGLPAINRGLQKTDVLEPDLEQWHKDNKSMQQEVTGWVVLTNSFLEWLWSNVNYHEVHHKYPYLSYKHLKVTFHATREQVPYVVVNGYTRSLLNLMKRDYYSQPEDVRPFLNNLP